MWPVGSSMASESRELSAACGLSGQVWRVSQGNWRRSVVCRVKFSEWVKGIVGRVWSVGSSLASGSRELSAACGLSARKRRVGQRNWRRVWSVGSSMASGSKELSASVVCRDKYGEWVKGIVGRVWSVGAKRASGSKELAATGVVCRVKFVAWVKRPVGGVWSVGSRLASGSRELSTACGLSGQVW